MDQDHFEKKRRYELSKFQNPKVKIMSIFYSTSNAGVYVSDVQPPTGINFNSTGCMQNLVCIQQGYANSQRIGNKIRLESVEFTFNLIRDNVLASLGYARFAIVYDRQTNGAYPAYSDIFNSMTQSGTLVTSVQSGQNPNNLERFEILYDKVWSLPYNDNLSTGPTDQGSFCIRKKIDLCGLETMYSGNALNATMGLTIANVTTGGLLLVAIGINAVGVDPWYASGVTRVEFTDA